MLWMIADDSHDMGERSMVTTMGARTPTSA